MPVDSFREDPHASGQQPASLSIQDGDSWPVKEMHGSLEFAAVLLCQAGSTVMFHRHKNSDSHVEPGSGLGRFP